MAVALLLTVGVGQVTMSKSLIPLVCKMEKIRVPIYKK
jgi:hypothetical protein